MLKIGLIGAGHLGKIHLKLLKELPMWEVVGFYDHDPAVREAVFAQSQVPVFANAEELIAKVDAVDIVTPTSTHFDYACQVMQEGKHLFVEKPLTSTLAEAEKLMQLHEKYPQLVGQVGHVERFNPAFLSVNERELQPMFIEGHRLATYNPRGTDVSVVLDLMIHDLDIVLSVVKEPIRSISASGVAVISEAPDIANARIEFENGCVANLTASRISVKQMRRLRLFQKNNYLAIDFLKKESEVFRLLENPASSGTKGAISLPLDSGKETKYLVFEKPETQEVNAIKMELAEFAASITEGQPIRVSLKDGYRALKVAHQILTEIDQRAASVW
jgi:predicted dehydrogenase